MLSPVYWSLDGTAIDFQPSNLSSKLGGYDIAAGTCSEDQIAHIGAEQGAVLKGVNGLGHLVWEGRLSLDPAFSDGEALLSARGYMQEAYLREERVTFQSRDLSDWVPGESTTQPWHFSNNRVSMSGYDTDVSGELYCYLEGQHPTRVAFTALTRNCSATATIYASKGGGSWTSKGTGGDVDISSPNSYDALKLIVSVTAGTGNWVYRMTNLRYNCVGTSDSMSAGAAVKHFASRLGWDARQVRDTGGNILPLDAEGDSWGAWLDYIALTSDSFWRVAGADSGGPALTFDRWGGNVWTVSLSDGAEADLMPQERYNQVRVTWNDGDAVRIAIANADPDPFERYKITRSFETNLPGVFHNSTLADYLARRLVVDYVKPRYAGRLTVSKARNLTTGETDLHALLPGDVVIVDDFSPSTIEPLRIHEVRTYEDHVVLGISQPASAASLINQMTLKRAGHMKRLHKRPRRPKHHLGTRGKPKHGLGLSSPDHLGTRGMPKHGP